MEDSSTGSDFETICENLLPSIGLLQVSSDDDDDDTVQTSAAAHSSSSSSSSALVPLSVPVPLYTDSMWAVHRSSSSRSNPQPKTITNSIIRFPLAFQANPLERCTSHDILLLAQDQWGSQYLQEQLISMDSRILKKLLLMVFRFTFELMSDQYGRFVFGKFIESCNESQMALITLKITFQDQLILQASSDHFGSSSIKKLIKVVAKSPLLHRIMSSLKRLFKFMMMTKPGSSVILQCLEPLYSGKNDLIYQAALEHCLSLACHEQGCINFNNFIDDMKGSRRKQILHLISKNAASLSKNPSGNYVVQHVLKIEDPHLIETICLALKGHYIDLSLTKPGSFVVQKCLQHQNTVHYIVEEFLSGDRILEVATDKYGNYVIQTALVETMRLDTLDLHQRLVSKLQKRRTALQMMKYGRNVYTMIRASNPGLA